MSEWESETHALTTVARNQNGNIRYVKVRAEYFEYKETEEGLEDEYAEGVAAKFKFDVTGGSIASLTGVKSIEDDAPNGYETNLDFLRAVPVAEEAVSNVPGIEEVHSTREYILSELDRGETATLD